VDAGRGESTGLGCPFPCALRADAVTEVYPAVRVHVRLKLLPRAGVVENAFTVGADPDPASQCFDLGEGSLKLMHEGRVPFSIIYM